MPMPQLPVPLRPREKLRAQGASALSDTELVAILLRTGHRGENVLQRADRVLREAGGLHWLVSDPPHEGMRERMGEAQWASLAVVKELARRAWQGALSQGPVFERPQQVKDYLRAELAHLPHEVFGVLLLDAQHRLLRFDILFRGTLSQTSVYPREIVKLALDHRAAALILTHNHPSGCAEPSAADRHLTSALKQALMLVDVQVLDHLIVAGQSVVSMAERGEA